MDKMIQDLPLVSQGKVRDIYEIPGRDMLLIHTTNRVSAFDVILESEIPQKGRVLTQTSLFWFDKTKDIIPNHLVEPQDVLAERYAPLVSCEVMVVKKLKPLLVEAVVRGYLAGSGWKDYQSTGQVCGHILPEGLKNASRLPHPIYTPATKAPIGEHDENITFTQTEKVIGKDTARYIHDVSIQLYQHAADYALERGIILADTKFEFGTDADGKVYLIDEVLTPDSSRYWALDTWSEGNEPDSFDKQFIRNYLLRIGWKKEYTKGVILPPEIIEKTTKLYENIQWRLTCP